MPRKAGVRLWRPPVERPQPVEGRGLLLDALIHPGKLAAMAFELRDCQAYHGFKPRLSRFRPSRERCKRLVSLAISPAARTRLKLASSSGMADRRALSRSASRRARRAISSAMRSMVSFRMRFSRTARPRSRTARGIGPPPWRRRAAPCSPERRGRSPDSWPDPRHKTGGTAQYRW